MHWTTVTTAFVVITTVYLLWLGLLLRYLIAATRWTGTSIRRRVRALGLDVLLLPWVVALAGLSGFVREFVLIVLPGVAVALWTFAPRYVTSKVVPLALVAVGLAGIVGAAAWPYHPDSIDGYGFSGWFWHGGSLNQVGPMLALVQAWAFITVGLWLAWRRMAPRSRQLLLREPVLVRGGVPGERSQRGRPRWGLLLLPVAVLIFERLGARAWEHVLSIPPAWVPYNEGAWVALAALAGVAAFLAFRLPALAADLAIVGLIMFGLDGIAIAMTQSWPAVAYGAAMVSAFGAHWLAAAQGLVLAGAGVWLLPRALDERTRARLQSAADRELAGRVVRLAMTRADAVDSAAAELRRLERDLHDGAQARLVALGISLRAAERLIHASPDAAAALVAEARECSLAALGELRDLMRGIRPPVLADRGLGEAVRALALDTPLRTDVEADLPGRPDLAVESACYFAVAELLANAVKHSGASHAHVRISHDAGALRITVTDDGAGGADQARGTGLAGLERRLATFDGVLAVSSPPGGPTIVAIEVPCALSSLKTSTCSGTG